MVVCTGRDKQTEGAEYPGLQPGAAAKLRCFLAGIVLLVMALPAAALQQTIRLDLYNVLASGGSGLEAQYIGLGRARLDMRSTGHRMVQGRLVLDGVVTDAPLTVLDISRASARFRIPVGQEDEEYIFRMMLGKDRISWGYTLSLHDALPDRKSVV